MRCDNSLQPPLLPPGRKVCQGLAAKVSGTFQTLRVGVQNRYKIVAIVAFTWPLKYLRLGSLILEHQVLKRKRSDFYIIYRCSIKIIELYKGVTQKRLHESISKAHFNENIERQSRYIPLNNISTKPFTIKSYDT